MKRLKKEKFEDSKKVLLLKSFPFDCWSHIILFFSSFNDLFSLMLTIKKLYEYLKYNNPYSCKNIIFKMRLFCDFPLNEKKIVRCLYLEEHVLSDDVFDRVNKIFPNLENLNFDESQFEKYECGNENIERNINTFIKVLHEFDFRSKFKFLKTLELSFSGNVNTYFCMVKNKIVVENLFNLENLCVKYYSFLENISNRMYFEISEYSEYCLDLCVKGMKKIKKLDLYGIRFETPIEEFENSIECLIIEMSTLKIENHTLGGLDKLSKLCVSDFNNIKKIINMPKLKKYTHTYGEFNDDESYFLINEIKNCPDLTFVEVQDGYSASEFDRKLIFSNLKSLKKLEVCSFHGCFTLFDVDNLLELSLENVYELEIPLSCFKNLELLRCEGRFYKLDVKKDEKSDITFKIKEIYIDCEFDGEDEEILISDILRNIDGKRYKHLEKLSITNCYFCNKMININGYFENLSSLNIDGVIGDNLSYQKVINLKWKLGNEGDVFTVEDSRELSKKLSQFVSLEKLQLCVYLNEINLLLNAYDYRFEKVEEIKIENSEYHYNLGNEKFNFAEIFLQNFFSLTELVIVECRIRKITLKDMKNLHTLKFVNNFFGQSWPSTIRRLKIINIPKLSTIDLTGIENFECCGIIGNVKNLSLSNMKFNIFLYLNCDKIENMKLTDSNIDDFDEIDINKDFPNLKMLNIINKNVASTKLYKIYGKEKLVTLNTEGIQIIKGMKKN